MEVVYKITNPSGSVYIGKTNNLEKRISYYNNGYCKTQKLIYNSILKHGWLNHTIEVIDICEDCSKKEMKWIAYYKTNRRRHSGNSGMNLSDGGEGNTGGCIVSVHEYNIDGTYVRSWDSQIEASNFHGMKSSHIAQACSGEMKTFAGKRWSYSRVDKLEEMKGKRESSKYNNIHQMDLNGNVIRVWNNISHIKMNMKITESNIIACISGKRKTHLGFRWKMEV